MLQLKQIKRGKRNRGDHQVLQPRSAHFAARVELVSGDAYNYRVAMIHRAEAERLYASHKANIPPGGKRQRNICKLWLADYFPKFEESRHSNSSKTTRTKHFVVTPGPDSPRYSRGKSIMGIVQQHKPISSKVRDLYGVRIVA